MRVDAKKTGRAKQAPGTKLRHPAQCFPGTIPGLYTKFEGMALFWGVTLLEKDKHEKYNDTCLTLENRKITNAHC